MTFGIGHGVHVLVCTCFRVLQEFSPQKIHARAPRTFSVYVTNQPLRQNKSSQNILMICDTVIALLVPVRSASPRRSVNLSQVAVVLGALLRRSWRTGGVRPRRALPLLGWRGFNLYGFTLTFIDPGTTHSAPTKGPEGFYYHGPLCSAMLEICIMLSQTC
jgi:hypothetical protein